MKDNGVVRSLPALPGVIANAFQCNGYVRLPNFDLLIISLSVKKILVVSYWFTTDCYAVHLKGFKCYLLGLVAMETAAVRHYPTVTKKHRNRGYFDQNDTVRIRNVTHLVHKGYIIANKVQKLQLLDDFV